MELLHAKRDDWFRFSDDLTIRDKGRGRLILAIGKHGSVYDDINDSPVNRPDDFAAATAVLAEVVEGYLDPAIARELLREVDDEISREIRGDAFVKGL